MGAGRVSHICHMLSSKLSSRAIAPPSCICTLLLATMRHMTHARQRKQQALNKQASPPQPNRARACKKGSSLSQHLRAPGIAAPAATQRDHQAAAAPKMRMSVRARPAQRSLPCAAATSTEVPSRASCPSGNLERHPAPRGGAGQPSLPPAPTYTHTHARPRPPGLTEPDSGPSPSPLPLPTSPLHHLLGDKRCRLRPPTLWRGTRVRSERCPPSPHPPHTYTHIRLIESGQPGRISPLHSKRSRLRHPTLWGGTRGATASGADDPLRSLVFSDTLPTRVTALRFELHLPARPAPSFLLPNRPRPLVLNLRKCKKSYTRAAASSCSFLDSQRPRHTSRGISSAFQRQEFRALGREPRAPRVFF